MYFFLLNTVECDIYKGRMIFTFQKKKQFDYTNFAEIDDARKHLTYRWWQGKQGGQFPLYSLLADRAMNV